MGKTIFITGIDTDCGKTHATGTLARLIMDQDMNVITQKLVQTGSSGMSADIILHRKIMGIDLQESDLNGLTAPYIFPFPASPHLSAKLYGVEILKDKISHANNELKKIYDIILLEGAGGLLVPINENMTTIDFISENNYPVILVTSSKLGSINHTLLSFEAMKHRNISLLGIIYNKYPSQNNIISKDSRLIFERYLKLYGFKCPVAELPIIKYGMSFSDQCREMAELVKRILQR